MEHLLCARLYLFIFKIKFIGVTMVDGIAWVSSVHFNNIGLVQK